MVFSSEHFPRWNATSSRRLDDGAAVLHQLVRQAAGPDLPIARTPYIGHGTDAHAAVIGKFYQISSD